MVMPVFLTKAIQCYVPTIVLGELYKGVYCSQKVEKNLAKMTITQPPTSLFKSLFICDTNFVPNQHLYLFL